MTSRSVTPERWNFQHKETTPIFGCRDLVRFFTCTDYVFFLSKLYIRFQAFTFSRRFLIRRCPFGFYTVQWIFSLLKFYSLFLTVGHVCKQNLFMGGSVDQDPSRSGWHVSLCLQHYTRSHIHFSAGEIVLSQSIVELVNRYIPLAALNAIGGRIVGPGEM